MKNEKINTLLHKWIEEMDDKEMMTTFYEISKKRDEKINEKLSIQLEELTSTTNTILSGIDFMITACLEKYGEDEMTMPMMIDVINVVHSNIKMLKCSTDKALE